MSRRRRQLLASSTLVASAVLAGACAKGGAQEVETAPAHERVVTATEAPPPPTRPEVAVPVYPLRGTVAHSAAEVAHPAVVVKIDNDPNARPQSGLNQADIVYEIEVEGITRFAAVFHAQDVPQVGPIRSARSSDIDLVAALERPLFAWSGANPTVIGEVQAAADRDWLVSVGHDASPDDYWRDNSRYAPHNLYSSTDGLRDGAPAGAGIPEPVWGYRSPSAELPESNFGTTGVAVAYQGDGRITNVEFVWDPDQKGWARFQDDFLHDDGSLAHVDAAGQQVAPENVVILMVEYGISAAGGSPQAISIGSGPAIVLTGEGRAVEGTWSRSAATNHFTLLSAEGDRIRLTPGRTWVLLPRAGHVTYLTPERGDHLLTAN